VVALDSSADPLDAAVVSAHAMPGLVAAANPTPSATTNPAIRVDVGITPPTAQLGNEQTRREHMYARELASGFLQR
jgi:hypothetical protein